MRKMFITIMLTSERDAPAYEFMTPVLDDERPALCRELIAEALAARAAKAGIPAVNKRVPGDDADHQAGIGPYPGDTIHIPGRGELRTVKRLVTADAYGKPRIDVIDGVWTLWHVELDKHIELETVPYEINHVRVIWRENHWEVHSPAYA